MGAQDLQHTVRDALIWWVSNRPRAEQCLLFWEELNECTCEILIGVLQRHQVRATLKFKVPLVVISPLVKQIPHTHWSQHAPQHFKHTHAHATHAHPNQTQKLRNWISVLAKTTRHPVWQTAYHTSVEPINVFTHESTTISTPTRQLQDDPHSSPICVFVTPYQYHIVTIQLSLIKHMFTFN